MAFGPFAQSLTRSTPQDVFFDPIQRYTNNRRRRDVILCGPDSDSEDCPLPGLEESGSSNPQFATEACESVINTAQALLDW